MMNKYPEIPTLPEVSSWPNRELPQYRFDTDIKDAMDSVSEFTDKLNSEFIPALNNILDIISTDNENLNISVAEAKELAESLIDKANSLNSRFDIVTETAAQLETTVSDYTELVEQLRLDQLYKISRNGNRLGLAGYTTAQSLSGSQVIDMNSPDDINIPTSGDITLSFTPAAINIRASKIICLYAVAQSSLFVSNSEWRNGETPPSWGATGSYLILQAYFCYGRVILSVLDNSQSG